MRLCRRCRRLIRPDEVGARLDSVTHSLVWCLDCWDAPDEEALRQYQHYGLAASMRDSPR